MNWNTGRDFAPLMLVMRSGEKYRFVGSLLDVAETLIGAWPCDDGEEYMEAVKVCLEAIEGSLSAEDARSALIKAAGEASIPVIAVVH